ncbi:polysaccharide biosynthesis protein [Ectothiorhodospiraceae bacterium 2226]|nr:polysaccharide biosynthesis protein [Ectothiorhodospiraceae bacterium 2226]
MVMAAWGCAFLVRHDFSVAAVNWDIFFATLPFVVAVQGVVLAWSGLYRGVWRFASIPDLWNIVRAVGLGVLLIGMTLFLFNRFEGVPRSSVAIYPLLLMVFLGAPRMLFRVWKDYGGPFPKPLGGKRVLVLGAGRAGEMLVRDMLRDGEYEPVAFLDDRPSLQGARVHGVPVLGKMTRLPRLVGSLSVDLVVIAVPSASSAAMRRIVGLCEKAGVTFRTVPRVEDMVSGKVSASALREVSLDDLLGREPVRLDWQGINQALTGKTILVTGGGGSIGSELCRQLARIGPTSLVILERSEYNLYAIEMELRQAFPELPLYPCLGDVCDRAAVEHVMQRFRPQAVFHAAAYKHVPMLQDQVREATRNNVVGTRVVAEAADRHGCQSFVLISTDKAVNPTNIMGSTKRVAEIFCQNMARRSNTAFITVRFGNVLGSAGSVVPLFQKQIAAGGPVTVTHPDITRFFMTIPEACQLIMQAGAMGRGGEIFVLDMGEPVRIGDLAEQMVRLSGKVPGRDIEIRYVGLRPGEKLAEELFHEQEGLTRTSHAKIMLADSRRVDWAKLQDTLAGIESACEEFEEQSLRRALKELVPEMSDPVTTPVAGDNVVEMKRRTS